jgi:hypothetical protein
MSDSGAEKGQSWAVRAAARYRREMQERHVDEASRRAEFQQLASKLWEQLRDWLNENSAAFNLEMQKEIFRISPSINSNLEVTAETQNEIRELLATYDADAGTITCEKPKLQGIPDNVITIEADPDTGKPMFAASDSRYYTAEQLGSTMLESLLYANWEE